jgi:LuxR family maltose regulon positive regulatory protein
MHRIIAQVGGGRLYQLSIKADPIVVGTPAWYDWLEQNTAFLFTDRMGSFTACKSGPVDKDQDWSATRFWKGRLYRVPLGPSRSLTLSLLQAAAEQLSSCTTTHQTDAFTAGFPLSLYPAYGTGFPLTTSEGLVRARLYRPALSDELLVRERLMERLQRGVCGRLTLLCAPVGFGKSTLLAQWAGCCGRAVAWLCLEQGDEVLAAFAHLWLAALRTCFPAACPATAQLLSQRQEVTVERLACVLLEDLAALPGEALLVLDEFDRLGPGPVQRLLATLIEHLPPPVHLALACRYEPGLPLIRWRARGWLQEVRAAELCLTERETQAVLERLVGQERARQSARVVWQRTEGWVALVRLVGVGLRQAADPEAYLAGWARVGERASSRYLVEELVQPQAGRVQRVLQRTGVLKQFNVALCAALLEGEESYEQVEELLSWMERAQLVRESEGEPGWYRYHPLVQQVLQQWVREEGSEQEQAEWHRRASDWYGRQGKIAEAVGHALAAGERGRAVEVVEAQVMGMVEGERVEELEGWLALLGEEQLAGSVGLLLARAWVKQVRGRLMDLPRLLTSAGQLLDLQARDTGNPNDTEYRVLRAFLTLGWSQFQFFTGQIEAALESAHSTLEWVPPECEYIASCALSILALAKQVSGQADVALFELNKALRDQPARHSVTARLLFTQAVVYLNAGKLQQVEQTASHLLQVAQQSGLALSQYWAHLLLGVVYYEWNQLDMAADHFNTVITNPHRAHFFAVRDAMCGLALTYQAQELSSQAKEVARALLKWVLEQQNMHELVTVYAFQAQLALLQDDMELAEICFAMAKDQTAPGSVLFFDCAEVHLLLTRGDEPGVVQAQELLTQCLQHVESSHNIPKTIKALAMQAWAYKIQGHESGALKALKRAFALARPGRFIRTFADLPPLARILQDFYKRCKAQQIMDVPLVAYLQQVRTMLKPEPAPPVSEKVQVWQEGLELLTNRERQILILLNKNLTNKEIARELVVTPGTVKVHTNSIYRKLSVNNRRSAIMLAKSLGILITH